jgi:hypothetical protein
LPRCLSAGSGIKAGGELIEYDDFRLAEQRQCD